MLCFTGLVTGRNSKRNRGRGRVRPRTRDNLGGERDLGARDWGALG
jgi:hypothetical protein